MEQPECPVCLQCYNTNDTIPRVLTCGHTVCECCLAQLPQRFPHTIRCPSCTHLIKFPNGHGPSSLPKNIDLLSLTHNHQTPNSPKLKKVNQFHDHKFWDDGFYRSWKEFVLPADAVLSGETSRLKDGKGVNLVKVGEMGGCVSLSYVVRVVKGLKGLGRGDLGLVFRVGRVYGVWGDLESGVLYLVCGKGMGWGMGGGVGCDGLGGFAIIAMEMCEGLMVLHSEGVVVGCLGLSCFEGDEFGRVCLNMGEVLVLGRKVWRGVGEAGSSGKEEKDDAVRGLLVDFWKSEVFVSPELFFELVEKQGVFRGSDGSKYPVGCESDVWSLAFCLLRLLVGKEFVDELVDWISHILRNSAEENSSGYYDMYEGLSDKVKHILDAKFGPEFTSLQQILCKCLNFDPGSRPMMTDIWKCIRELICKPQYDIMVGLKGPDYRENKFQCLVLGDLCQFTNEKMEMQKANELQGIDDKTSSDNAQPIVVKAHKHIVEGIPDGNIKCKDMQGHMDRVTGLAVGGGFLFSSSFDKTVNVWALQDFSHVHTFRGHEHRVMDVVYVDEEQPLCISGDHGGGIFVWEISTPLRREPLKKWYEEKDWRYSGIHALAAGGNGYLYTGSGDKSVKAWLLQDGTLACTMTGHSSVVSALSICNGVLYSGSWDGTIRLWSLVDHSLLTVLGENTSRSNVLSLAADQHMLVAGYMTGCIKIWMNDVNVKSTQVHSGAVFAIDMEGKWLFTGGWDKSINVQECSGDELELEIKEIGSIPYGPVITAMLCWEGKLFVGSGDRVIKAYCYGK